MQTFTHAHDLQDPAYKANRRHILKELSTQSESALREQIDYLASQPAPTDESGVAVNMLHNIRGLNVPSRVKSILDSTSGTTGSVLIRQDLEPVIFSLFVRNFPLYEILPKGPSNGLTLLAPAA